MAEFSPPSVTRQKLGVYRMASLQEHPDQSFKLAEASYHLYNLHNLLYVRVHEAIDPAILEGVEFQIGPLRTDAGSSLPKDGIDIIPFDVPSANGQQTYFHTARSVFGKEMVFPNLQLKVRTNDNGLTIEAGKPTFVINPYMHSLLLQKHVSMVHAAAIMDPCGDVLLIAGAGGVGKTSALGEIMSNSDYRFLGDDVVLLGADKSVYSFPRKMVIKPGHEHFYRGKRGKRGPSALSFHSSGQYAKRIIVENMPFLGLVKWGLQRMGIRDTVSRWVAPPKGFTTVNPEELFGTSRMGSHGVMRRILFLERYNGVELERNEISTSHLKQRLFSIMWHEWEGYMRQWFALSAVAIVDASETFRRMDDVLDKALSGMNGVVLRVPDDYPPKDLANQILLE